MANHQGTTSTTEQHTGTEDLNKMKNQPKETGHVGSGSGMQGHTMSGQQNMMRGQQGTSSQHRTSHQGMAGSAEQATGVEDKTYNLVSILYHALQGGKACMQYMQDAQQQSDHELVQFFEEAQECQRHLASQAEQMLAQRLQQQNGKSHDSSRPQSMQSSSGQSQPFGQGHAMPGQQSPTGPGSQQQDKHGAATGGSRGAMGSGARSEESSGSEDAVGAGMASGTQHRNRTDK